MTKSGSEQQVVFRAGIHLYVIVGIFASFFIALGVAIVINEGQWAFVALAGAGTVIWFLLLSYLKLVIYENGFTYRNLSTNRSVEFADVEMAYFATIKAKAAPQGVAAFWVRSCDGKAMKINLRTFPIRAAALLFDALERHGVPIEVPDTWSAQRMARQIREAQAKLRI